MIITMDKKYKLRGSGAPVRLLCVDAESPGHFGISCSVVGLVNGCMERWTIEGKYAPGTGWANHDLVEDEPLIEDRIGDALTPGGIVFDFGGDIGLVSALLFEARAEIIKLRGMVK